ncbi:hypothetical protein [Natronogracilivirga saccharolytica]|uniref:Magnesium transporter MgtE intracellular domain-containing protein n=1 Tax=Natronogracilivirga saccharolytica TaxID=2812953 RepID=A0A8J7RQA1_9BACT|nr:hypothetical protein [Natronogracilivirga saccharolytica]MBP3191939.1 hypothetical protein [Natronogracilivirga saccharolytica]
MKALKILGIVVGTFVGTSVLMFFLYPHIHPDRAGDVEKLDEDPLMAGSVWEGDVMSPEECESLQSELESLHSENAELMSRIDSLDNENEKLKAELADLESAEPQPADEAGIPAANGTTITMDDEDFAERVKSLLNLDEEELAPIVQNMEDSQLVRLYRSAGSIQREKLLRSLAPDRAAKLMNEVMS